MVNSSVFHSGWINLAFLWSRRQHEVALWVLSVPSAVWIGVGEAVRGTKMVQNRFKKLKRKSVSVLSWFNLEKVRKTQKKCGLYSASSLWQPQQLSSEITQSDVDMFRFEYKMAEERFRRKLSRKSVKTRKLMFINTFRRAKLSF